MWTPRTPEQILKWQASATREARFQASLYAGLCWFGIAAALAGGWMAGANAGLIAQDSIAAGSFWHRFPIYALPGIPVAYWLYRRTFRLELQRATYMTICPKCDTADESNEGQTCDCGGTFVTQSSVRWVEDEPKE
jgi:hypothetical protein